ncbi:MAG TPA: oxalate/formate MFS antiporter [Aliidongia sp.]|uniref:oxalate/formate MFS antiporter n=1 Tax=Aliidongia sp. TaxID=1914230 RepID=UPI002DDD29EC|nr:oxalate/formate MFS antiporter [Aliidongia sp.]HEV2673928.1 oxalate/formate MFS antiporter [Aliidongia sp.]
MQDENLSDGLVARGPGRWGQLALGIVGMMMIANLQYGWTLFVVPIDQAHHWGIAQIQVAFTLFVLGETWLLPFQGYLVDRIGPRPTVAAGGVLVAAAWMANSAADSLALLYVAAVVGGTGAGMIYGAAVGNALKWFPDRRGLAAGLTAAGFGAGSAATIVPIAHWIQQYGYQSAFFWWGLGQGVVVIVVSGFLRAAPPGPGTEAIGLPIGARPQRHGKPAGDKTPGQVLAAPIFWLMYLMFVLVCAGGLMATAQLSVIARDFGVADQPVMLLGLTLPALTFALSLDRIMNGITRPFFGWVSDRIGREPTMFVAFLLEGLGILALRSWGDDPVRFVLLSGLVFFAWGEIYSLFPALSGDIFGRRFATANYGLLYTAKGTAALLVPLASVLKQSTGDWNGVFLVSALCNLLAAFLAILVLRPMRRRRLTVERRLALGGPGLGTPETDRA